MYKLCIVQMACRSILVPENVHFIPKRNMPNELVEFLSVATVQRSDPQQCSLSSPFSTVAPYAFTVGLTSMWKGIVNSTKTTPIRYALISV